MSTPCSLFNWSPSSLDSLVPNIVVASIAIVIHFIFWVQFAIFSTLRERNMMWLYAYLITDFILIARFFILYGIRRASVCLYQTPRDVLCYFEASSKFYINIIQTYLLLAFNICRYKQIVSNRNVYTERPRLIVFIHFLINVLPAINVVIQFLTNQALIWRRRGDSCDVQYNSTFIQIFNVFVTYVIPVVINIITLGLGIRRVSSTKGVLSEQIILLRRKRQRILVLQTLAFYSIWLVLWSPDVLSFQFTNINSDPAAVTTLLSYIEIAVDPIIICIIDVRFLTTWSKLWTKLKRHRQIAIA
jgi:hypothetical protein